MAERPLCMYFDLRSTSWKLWSLEIGIQAPLAALPISILHQLMVSHAMTFLANALNVNIGRWAIIRMCALH